MQGRSQRWDHILFGESAEFGYPIVPGISVSALLDHISNANLGQHNMGHNQRGSAARLQVLSPLADPASIAPVNSPSLVPSPSVHS